MRAVPDNADLGLPFGFSASPGVVACRLQASELSLSVGGPADLFNHPAGVQRIDNAAELLGQPADGDFRFAARVRPGLASVFDAGGLVLRCGIDHWAKLCVEMLPSGQQVITSVVTRELSDDSNGALLAAADMRLRICRIGRRFAFHASSDGQWWDLVRHFHLAVTEPVRIGFLAQSPAGAGLTCQFSEVRFEQTELPNIHSGV